jgi:hypothetical protein
MSIRPTLFTVDAAEVKRSFSFSEMFRLAFRLTQKRQRLLFASLVGERVALGVCDLLVAGAMYLLFLLLQGGSPSHHFWWTPKTTLAAALLTAGLVVLRSVMDLVSTRREVGYIQNLYRDFSHRLTHGYGEMRWASFVDGHLSSNAIAANS